MMKNRGKGNGKAAKRPIECCRRCGRPSSFWGSRDRKTGWHGWCYECNWKWQNPDGLTVWELHLQNRGRLPEVVLLGVRPFLVDFVQAQSEWCEIHTERWMRILISDLMYHVTPEVRDEQTGEIRIVDTDDEDEETGVFDAHLNYTNPLWKMQLADGPHSPLKILGELLGMCYIPN